MNLKEFVGKRVYVKLISGKIFTGECKSIDWVGKDSNGMDIFIFSMIERDGKFVAFSNSEIKYIEEQNV